MSHAVSAVGGAISHAFKTAEKSVGGFLSHSAKIIERSPITSDILKAGAIGVGVFGGSPLLGGVLGTASSLLHPSKPSVKIQMPHIPQPKKTLRKGGVMNTMSLLEEGGAAAPTRTKFSQSKYDLGLGKYGLTGSSGVSLLGGRKWM